MLSSLSSTTTHYRRGESLDTLDEPVYKTILRDLQRVGHKLLHVLLPRGQGIPALRDCTRYSTTTTTTTDAYAKACDTAV